MVIKRILKNKDGEELKTKKGEVLTEYVFEKGDIFIPKFNNINIKSHLATIDGKQKTIYNYTLLCKVKDFPEKNENSEVFIKLTPTQFKSLDKKLKEGIQINQELFNCYGYKDNDNNEWVGVGLKSDLIPAKDFSDFEGAKNE